MSGRVMWRQSSVSKIMILLGDTSSRWPRGGRGAPRGQYRIYVTYAFSDSRTTPHTQYADAVRVSDINQSGLYVKHTMNVETQAIANILCLKDYGMSTETRTTTHPRPGPAQPRSDPTSTNQPQAPR